jgi:hypothetical protein
MIFEFFSSLLTLQGKGTGRILNSPVIKNSLPHVSIFAFPLQGNRGENNLHKLHLHLPIPLRFPINYFAADFRV